MDKIHYEAKTDRELLLITVEEVNNLSEKLDSVCGIMEAYDKMFEKQQAEISANENKIKNINTMLKGVVAGIVAIASTVVGFLLNHIFSTGNS